MMSVNALEQISSLIKSAEQPKFDPMKAQQDLSIMGLITIIKNARLPRAERDRLSDWVKWQAVMNPEGISHDFVKGMLRTIFLLEIVHMGKQNKQNKNTIMFPLEKTPHQEMEETNDLRARKETEQKKLNDLKSTISKTV